MSAIRPSSPAQEQLLKSKAIEQYMEQDNDGQPAPTGNVDVAWPEGSADDGDDGSNNNNKAGPTEEEIEAAAMLGYEDAAPTVATSHNRTARPRRSSLRHSGIPRRASIGYSGEMTLRLPTNQTVKKRTSITFDDAKNETHEVERLADMTDHPERLWFQAEEYAHIKEKVYAILKQSKGAEKSMLCTRGLEPLITDQSLERKDAYESVFDEQQSQRKQGRYDDSSLSQMYVFHTIDSKVNAAMRAEQDEADIANYTKATRRMMRRLSC